jgi:hypothetical protein
MEDGHWQREFGLWRFEVSDWLSQERGRSTRLADWLGVSRQRVSQWFIIQHRNVPGWTVQPTLEFLERENTLGELKHPSSQDSKSPGLGQRPNADCADGSLSHRLGRALDLLKRQTRMSLRAGLSSMRIEDEAGRYPQPGLSQLQLKL